MKKEFFPLLSLAPASVLLLASSVAAKDISSSRAIASPTPIAVEVGRGHTIDFSSTGEQVFKGWIGDGGRCLVFSSSSPLEDGAPIVNLRRITPCQRVTGLPKVSQTTLTLITLSPDRQERIYVFNIDYSASGESLTRVVPDGAIASAATPSPSNDLLQDASLDTAVVEEGLRSFRFPTDSQIVSQVQAWVEAVEGGATQRRAAQTVGIDWSVLRRLEQIGAQNAALAQEGAIGI